MPAEAAPGQVCKLRAVGYARVSTLQQGAGVSIDAQSEAIEAYCLAEGLELVAMVNEVFSGTKLNREKLDAELLPMVRARQVDVIICYDQDRWFRNEYARLKLEKEILEPNGVALRFVTEGNIGTSHDRDLVRGVKGSVAQHFAQITKAKVKDAMAHKARRGEYCGGNVPYGYKPVKVDERTNQHGKVKPISKLGPHPKEAPVVLFIKEIYGFGASQVFSVPQEFGGKSTMGANTIAKILNSLGLKRRNGKPWNTAIIKNLIRDENNYHIGTFSYRKTIGDKDERRRMGSSQREQHEIIELPQCYPPIVPPELQKLCQEKIGQKGKRSKRFSVQRSQYLGSGLFNCKACGGILLGRTRTPHGRHKKREMRYMCANRYNQAGCEAPMVKADYLHQGLDEVMRLFLQKPENVARLAESVAELVRSEHKAKPQGIEVLEARLGQVSNQKENLLQNLKEAPDLGRMLRDEWLALDAEERRLGEALEQIRKERELGSSPDIRERVRVFCQNAMQVWEEAPIGVRNKLLKSLVHRAEVDCSEKRVVYYLALPLDDLLPKGHRLGGGLQGGGCIKVMAEAHGNRTHLPHYSYGTPDLKSEY